MDVAVQFSRFLKDNGVFPVTHLHGVVVVLVLRPWGAIVLIDLILALFVHLDNERVMES